MRKCALMCAVALAFNMMAGLVHAGVDPSLVGWWTFDEGQGTIAHDSSGNGNDGTLTNDPEWTVGHLGGALAFPTTVNAYVEVPDSPELNPVETITITAWINPEWTGNNRIMQKGSSDNQFRLLRENGDNFVFHLAGLTNGRLEGFATPPDGEWTHVASTYDGSAMKVYYNAEVAGEQAASGQISTSGDSLFIGTKHATAPVGDGFGGKMDDVRLYNRAVAQEEIPGIMRGISPALASDPNPEDEAIDVPRDTLLTWTVGKYAATHDVYLGTASEDVNDAGRTDPMGVLLSQGQSETTFDPPGLLDFGQTYYWRVDEVNAAPDNTVYKGEVWSFTTEPFAYPIQDVIATSNGISTGAATPERTVDGSGINADGQASTNSSDMWVANAPADETLYIQFEFDRVYKLYEMLVWNYNVQFELILGFGLKDVTVEYSQDGVDWTVLGDETFAQATASPTYVANTTVDFGGVPVKYVRLTVNSGWGTMGQYGLSEVRFMYIPAQAREPQPADEAGDVAVGSALTWRAGREAVTHEVYFGSDPEALTLVDTTGATTYTPDALDLATTYFWKVDEVNEADAVSVWEGDVWSFSVEEYIVVDDFESYNDDVEAGTTIFDTWIDGWVNDNGSTVGYFDAPFAEQAIVHGGGQSMPFEYDNSSVSFAEAERTLPSEDWTGHGIKSLSLYFYGAVDNTGQLYVKINGTKILYDGPSVNIQRPSWQLWSIDLSQVGNVSNVTSLVIGVDGAGAKGMLFIDDIRLYPEVLDATSPDITGAGDTVQGVPNDGDWPDAETPPNAIDDNVNTKYLHRKGGSTATGFQVAPLLGSTIVTGLTFTSANDDHGRDPTSFELSGSNTSIDGPYTLIASGDIVDFSQPDVWPRYTKTTTPIEFENAVAYTYYQIVFPTLRPDNDGLMQIAEVEFIGTPVE